MTLTELVALFDREKRLFIGTLIGTMILSLLAYQFQPVRYTNELLLTVTRTSVPTTAEYAYDHFYRLQADERIAESISQYLQSETGKRDVAERAKLEGTEYQQYMGAKLKAVRLGTNGIKVNYRTNEVTGGEKIGEAMVFVVNEYIFSLNEDARQKEWFMIMGEKPIMQSAIWSLERFFLIGIVSGIFFGFWAVLGRYFWKNYQKEKRLMV